MPVNAFGYTNVAAVQATDSASIDAFGRWRSSDPETIFDSKLLFDAAPLFWDDQATSGSGTSSSHSTNTASSTLGTTASTAGTRVRQTFRRFNYQPGKSQLIFMTGNFNGGASGMTKRIGLFDTNNGLYFQLAGTTLSVVRRTYTSGSPVNTVVPQREWNIDKMDGTGRSGVNLDMTKAQIMVIDFEWLGVGRVRMGWVIDGQVLYCHQFLNTNNLTTVYMSTPNLPLRYECANDGTATASLTLTHICSSVISEGGQQERGVVLTTSTGNTQVNADVAGTIYACLGLRLKTTHLAAAVEPLTMSMMGSTANDPFQWMLYLNPTVAGAFTYSDVTNSACQRAQGDTANTVSGGTLLNSGFYWSQGSIGSQILTNAIQLGSNIAGTRDELVLAVMPIAGAASLDIYASLTWRELL